MDFQRSELYVSVCILMLAGAFCRAENLVGYSVRTGCTAEWDIAVNDVPFVRHRPTGFGRCIYSGSINRAVTNGWNNISLSRVGSSAARHKPEADGCIALEITYVEAYRGQADMGNVKTVLSYSGSDSTNLLFTVEGEISNISGGTLTDAFKPSFMASTVFRVLFGIYLLFINIYGYFMVFNDQRYAKRRQTRISEADFVWNAFLGGGFGQLIGMFTKRHNTDKTRLTVGIPMLLLLQIAAIVYFTTPHGRRVASRAKVPSAPSSVNAIFDNTSRFLNSLKRDDPGEIPK